MEKKEEGKQERKVVRVLGVITFVIVGIVFLIYLGSLPSEKAAYAPSRQPVAPPVPAYPRTIDVPIHRGEWSRAVSVKAEEKMSCELWETVTLSVLMNGRQYPLPPGGNLDFNSEAKPRQFAFVIVEGDSSITEAIMHCTIEHR